MRPSSRASAAITSSSLNLLPSSPRSNLNDQPPYSKSSEPPGSSITPSRDTNCVTTISPISSLLVLGAAPPGQRSVVATPAVRSWLSGSLPLGLDHADEVPLRVRELAEGQVHARHL